MALARKPVNSTFVCAGCIETNQDPFCDAPGMTLAGIQYCQVCAEERQDELAIQIRERLRKGPLHWGTHYLGVSVHPVKDELVTSDDMLANEIAAQVLGDRNIPAERGFFTLDIVCHCNNANNSSLHLYRSYGEFWQEFAKFCNQHHDQLKRLVN
jgi:hypothetical protein